MAEGRQARLYTAAPAHSSAGPVITSLQLLDLGQQLMEESKPAPGDPIRMHDAVCFRDGLMLAFIAFCPIRLKNLAALEIDRHLIRKDDRWRVIIPREETKTRTPIEFPFPELLVPYLTLYLDVVRPRILRRSTCTALWVSPKGGRLSYCAVGTVFIRVSTSRLRIRITPHDARDAATTTWAISKPAQIGIARDLLAHADLRTTIKHYNRARGIEASRAYGQLITEIRKQRSGRSRWSISRRSGQSSGGGK